MRCLRNPVASSPLFASPVTKTNSQDLARCSKKTIQRLSSPCHSLAGVVALLASFQATAGIPTYKVFFDGGGTNAGSMVVQNGATPPEGACGMRINGADLLDFYWAEYNPAGLGAPMAEPPFGPPSSATYDFPAEALETVIEFTGPIAEGCGDEWVFHLPLTGDWPTFANGTPSGAGALVFQVTLPNGIEWLDAGFQVWEESEDDPWGEDPEFPSFCEQWPDACDEDPGFTYEDPCNSTLWQGICGDASRGTGKTLAAEYLATIANQQIQLLLPAVQSAREAARRHQSALEAVDRGLLQIQAVRDTQFDRRKSTVASAKYAAAVKAQLGIAEIELRSCQQSLVLMRKTDLSAARYASAHCSAAIQALVASRDQMRQLPKE